MTANETPAKCAFCGKEPIILANPLGTREPDYACQCITFFQHSVPGLAMWNAAQEKLASRDKELERVAFEAGYNYGGNGDSVDEFFDDWQREREGK